MKTITITSVSVDDPAPGQITIVGTYADVAHTRPAQQVTVGEIPPGNQSFSRAHQLTDAIHKIGRVSTNVAVYLSSLAKVAFALEPTLTYAPKINSQPVNAATAFAKTTLTSDDTNVSNNNTVTIGSKIYTFKTSLSPAEGEVLIGADADASLLNLIRAINHSGTPDTDYKCAAAHPEVSAAASVTAHGFLITALAVGSTVYFLSTSAATLAFSSVTVNGGLPAAQFDVSDSSSELSVSYAWQYSTDGMIWVPCVGTINGCTYDDTVPGVLTCTPTTLGQSGKYHRCAMTNARGSATTNGNAVLTIT